MSLTKNKFFKIVVVLFAFAVGFASVEVVKAAMAKPEVEAKLAARDSAEKASEAEKENLIRFVRTTMEMEPKSKISDARKVVLSEKLAGYLMVHLDNQVDREQYVSMVKIESNFDNVLRSPVGAVGIGQVMPGTFNSVIKNLAADLGAKPEDITNEDVNLLVGIIYFKQLLEDQGGNPRLAAIAYNGGGKTADRFKKMTDINAESANYALKADHVRETAKKLTEGKETK